MWATPCLIHLSDRTLKHIRMRGRQRVSFQGTTAWLCTCSSICLGAAPRLSLVLPCLVISSYHLSNSVCYGQWQVQDVISRGDFDHLRGDPWVRLTLRHVLQYSCVLPAPSRTCCLWQLVVRVLLSVFGRI